MKILVTGATGFVGHAMIEHLTAQKDVTPIAGIHQSKSVFTKPTEELQMGDLGCDSASTADLTGIDTIIHCAARVHVMQENAENALQAYRTLNAQATMRLAQRASDAGVRRFVFISSIKVNGEMTQSGQKFGPDDRTIPTDPYGLSKWEAEQALLTLAKSSKMEVVIVRPPLVYGPGVGANFRAMMRWIKMGIPLPLRNTDNARGLVGIDNLTSFLWACVQHPEAKNQIFLVSDNRDVSTSALLIKLAKHLSKPNVLFPAPRSLIKLVAALIGRQNIYDRLYGSLQLDISKNKQLLGWEPPKTLDEGLAATAHWYASL